MDFISFYAVIRGARIMRSRFVAILMIAVAICFAGEAPVSAPVLDLEKLTAQDSEDFAEYSKRISLIEESAKNIEILLQSQLSSTADSLPPLAPKAEDESDSSFESRKSQYELDVFKAARQKEEASLLMKRLGEMNGAINRLRKIQMGMLSSILVKTTPDHASVSISSQDIVLRSPAQFEHVRPGDVTVSVSMDGYAPSVLPLVIAPHEKREVDVALVPASVVAEASKSGWTWRGYARISSFVVGAAFFGAGLYENLKAKDIADDYNGLVVRSQKSHDKADRDIGRRETLRNVYYGIAGAVTAMGVATFFF